MSKANKWIIGAMLVLLVGASGGLYFWRSHARQSQEIGQCQASLRNLSIAILTYSTDNKGWMPPTLQALPSAGESMVCPAGLQRGLSENSQPAGSYIYTAGNLKITQLKLASETVVAYEPLSYHGGSGMHVLYLDGHTRWLKGDKAESMMKELGAGHNPPNVQGEEKKEEDED